jgi:hypothetical protein
MSYSLKVAIAVLGLLAVVTGGATLVLVRTGRSSGSEAQAALPTAPPRIAPSAAGIPLLDVSLSGQTETATFALG